MATILTQAPVNPWAVMGANLVGNLLGDMLQRSREAEKNRKMNALFNEALNSVNAPQAQNFTAQSQVMPEGYDTDPWAAAMHKSYTPMTQYNIGTADINPLAQAAQQANTPNVQDMRNAIMQNLGSKRFSMLDPALVEQYMTPYYQGMEQQRNEAMKRDYADKLMNAKDGADRRNIAWSGAAESVLPWDVVNAANNEYRYDNLSEADKANYAFREREFDTQTDLTRERMNRDDARYYSNQDYMRDKDAQEQNRWEREFAARRADTRYEREHPGYSSVFTGDDGGQWLVDRNGNTKRLNTGESSSGGQLTEIEQNRIQNKQSRMSELEKQKYELLKEKASIVKTNLTGDSSNTEFLDNRIAEIDDEIGTIRDEINSIYQSKIKTSDVNPLPENKTSNISYKKNPNMSKWKYGDFVDKAASKYDVDPALIQAIIRQESAENTNAKSPKGAMGLMQLMPETAKELGVTDAFDPEQNVNGGTKYLSKLLKKYNGDIEKALWGYNAGPGNVANGRKPDETKDYIQKVLGYYKEYSDTMPNALGKEDYADLVKKVKAGKISGVENEAELQAKLKKYGRSFDIGISSEDVKPPFPTESEDIKPQHLDSPHYGLDKRKFRSK